MKGLLFLGLGLFAAHVAIVEFYSSNFRACDKSSGGYDGGVCACVKSSARASLAVERMTMGSSSARSQLSDKALACKMR